MSQLLGICLTSPKLPYLLEMKYPLCSWVIYQPLKTDDQMKNGGFLKWGDPQIIHFHGKFHYKPSILGHPHFRKPQIGWKKPVMPRPTLREEQLEHLWRCFDTERRWRRMGGRPCYIGDFEVAHVFFARLLVILIGIS